MLSLTESSKSKVATVVTSKNFPSLKKNGLWHVVLIAGGFQFNLENLYKKLSRHAIEVKYFWENDKEKTWTTVPSDVDFVILLKDSVSNPIEEKLRSNFPDVPILYGYRKWASLHDVLRKNNIVETEEYTSAIRSIKDLKKGKREEVIKKMGKPAIVPMRQQQQQQYPEVVAAEFVPEEVKEIKQAQEEVKVEQPSFSLREIAVELAPLFPTRKAGALFTAVWTASRALSFQPTRALNILSGRNVQKFTLAQKNKLCDYIIEHSRSTSTNPQQQKQRPQPSLPTTTPPAMKEQQQQQKQQTPTQTNQQEFQLLVTKLAAICKAANLKVSIEYDGTFKIRRKKVVETEEELTF